MSHICSVQRCLRFEELTFSLCQSYIPLDDFFHKYKYLRCLGEKTEVSVLANLQSTGNVEATNGKKLKYLKDKDSQDGMAM